MFVEAEFSVFGSIIIRNYVYSRVLTNLVGVVHTCSETFQNSSPRSVRRIFKNIFYFGTQAIEMNEKVSPSAKEEAERKKDKEQKRLHR